MRRKYLLHNSCMHNYPNGKCNYTLSTSSCMHTLASAQLWDFVSPGEFIWREGVSGMKAQCVDTSSHLSVRHVPSWVPSGVRMSSIPLPAQDWPSPWTAGMNVELHRCSVSCSEWLRVLLSTAPPWAGMPWICWDLCWRLWEGHCCVCMVLHERALT